MTICLKQILFHQEQLKSNLKELFSHFGKYVKQYTNIFAEVGGLLPYADNNKSGIIPAQYKLSNSDKLATTNYIIFKGHNYISNHIVLLSIERPANTTFAIITVSTNSSSNAYDKLTSSKVTYAVNQLVMRILVQIWAFYNDAF